MNEILLMLLIGICGSIIGGIIVWFLYERLNDWKERFFSKPYVAILVSRDVERDFNIPKDLRDGIDEKIQERGIGLFFRSKGKNVAIHFEDDHLDKTISSEIIQKLIEDENCILLIANANSTLTNSNINELLNAKKKIPLIMPIATDYSIIEKTNENNYKGILRMMPDNDKQAELIQRFISDKLQIKGHNVAIFGDDKNNLYSENMLDNIANRLRTTGNFVIDKIIGKSLPAPNELDNVVAVIYAGIPPRALSLQDDLQRLLKIGQNKIPLIMTDGCLGSSTFRPIQSVNSYILSPINFEGLSNKSGSYKPVGNDTYELCAKILSMSKPTRKSVYETIEKGRGSRDENKNYNIKSVSGKSYKFNADGNNEGWGYSVYPIKDGGLDEKIFE